MSRVDSLIVTARGAKVMRLSLSSLSMARTWHVNVDCYKLQNFPATHKTSCNLIVNLRNCSAAQKPREGDQLLKRDSVASQNDASVGLTMLLSCH